MSNNKKAQTKYWNAGVGYGSGNKTSVWDITKYIDTDEDLVTSRILWLEGTEVGLNKGPGIDSKSRYIYIHGTAEEGLIGQPASDGCIRMYNDDVIELFTLAPLDTEVWIY